MEHSTSSKLIRTSKGQELILFFTWHHTSFDLTAVAADQRVWSRQGDARAAERWARCAPWPASPAAPKAPAPPPIGLPPAFLHTSTAGPLRAAGCVKPPQFPISEAAWLAAAREALGAHAPQQDDSYDVADNGEAGLKVRRRPLPPPARTQATQHCARAPSGGINGTGPSRRPRRSEPQPASGAAAHRPARPSPPRRRSWSGAGRRLARRA